MKNNTILTILLCGLLPLAGCGTLKAVGGYFANIGEAVVGQDKDPEDVSSGDPNGEAKPFVPTEKQVETGRSIVGWFVFVIFIFGLVFLFRLLYFHKKKKKKK